MAQVVRPDYGADFYAGITFNNLPRPGLRRF